MFYIQGVNGSMGDFVSVVIPVYNNQGSLKESFNQIRLELDSCANCSDFEVIFVNDGSKDNSQAELIELTKTHEKVKVIEFSRNFGQIPATTAGIRYALGDKIIVISADLQDPISLFTELLDRSTKGADIVIAYRKERNEGIVKKLTSRVYFRMLQYHTMANVPEGGFDYFLLTKPVAQELNKIDNKIRGLHYDILSLGFNISFIPYTRKKREIGKSQYTFFKRLTDFFNAFLSISFLPIRFIIWIGITFLLFAFIYALSIARAWYFGQTPFEGWAPLMVLLLLSSGIIMVMIGVLGEYVWRVYEETKNRPNYIVKKVHTKE